MEIIENELVVNKNFSLKRVFLITLITSLSISALIAIVVFLFGNFDAVAIKILLTTVIIGGYSLTGLCSSVLLDKNKYVTFGYMGIVVSLAGFLITTGTIWDVVDFSGVLKTMFVLIILSVSVAHASLLLLAESDKSLINIFMILTIVFITLVAGILIYLVLIGWHIFSVDNFIYRLLGVFAVFDVLGTIVTPLLKKNNNM